MLIFAPSKHLGERIEGATAIHLERSLQRRGSLVGCHVVQDLGKDESLGKALCRPQGCMHSSSRPKFHHATVLPRCMLCSCRDLFPLKTLKISAEYLVTWLPCKQTQAMGPIVIAWSLMVQTITLIAMPKRHWWILVKHLNPWWAMVDHVPTPSLWQTNQVEYPWVATPHGSRHQVIRSWPWTGCVHPISRRRKPQFWRAPKVTS